MRFGYFIVKVLPKFTLLLVIQFTPSACATASARRTGLMINNDATHGPFRILRREMAHAVHNVAHAVHNVVF